MHSHSFRLFVIGASAGGQSAVKTALSNIPSNINAAFLVVIHSSSTSTSYFKDQLAKKIGLKVVDAENNLKIQAGTVYLSVADQHMIVKDGMLGLSYGPRENLCRPSIDTLFRSAAVNYKNQCVGILLSGRLNDGSVGLESIKVCGGLAVIQNPETAEFNGMPLFAQQFVAIDYTLELEEMSEVIEEIMHDDIPEPKEVPDYLIKENAIAAKVRSNIEENNELGTTVPVSCPECNGPLWKMTQLNTVRFRCHLGHSYTEDALLETKNSGYEEAMWIALRILEEKRMLLLRIIANYKDRKMDKLVLSYESKLDEVLGHIKQLRSAMQIEKQ